MILYLLARGGALGAPFDKYDGGGGVPEAAVFSTANLGSSPFHGKAEGIFKVAFPITTLAVSCKFCLLKSDTIVQ